MRAGRLISVLAFTGMAAVAAPRTSPEAAGQGRQLVESAVGHERAGKNHAAIEELSRAISSGALSGADQVRAQFDRGVAYDALGDMPAAVSDYTAALRLDPAFAPAMNNRANVFRRMGRLDLARRDYLAALRISSGSHEYAYYGLGLMAEQTGDIDGARDFYQRALAANPAYAVAAQSLTGLSRPNPPAGTPAVLSAAVQPVQILGPVAPDAALRHSIDDTGLRAAPRPVAVQLGAYRNKQTALDAWHRIATSTEGLLDRLSPMAQPVERPGKPRLWRLRTTVSDRVAARELCDALVKQNQPCMLAWD